MRSANVSNVVLAILFISIFGISSRGEHSSPTSIVALKKFFDLKVSMVDEVWKRTHSAPLIYKSESLRSALQNMKRETNRANSNIETFLSNPINTFALIRHMHSDWMDILLFMKKELGKEHTPMVNRSLHQWPTDQDLDEAVSTIINLQHVYDIKTADMAAGILNGKIYNTKMAAIDSYTIGFELFKKEEYFHASLWLLTSLQTFEDSALYKILGFNELQVESLFRETTEILYKQKAFKKELFKISFDHNKDASNLALARSQLEQRINYKLDQVNESIQTAYEIGCRGEFKYPTNNSKLVCHYQSSTHAFLKLARIKFEALHLAPQIFLIHDLISDKEIEHLISLASPKLSRALVYSSEKRELLVNRSRTLHKESLHPQASTIVQNIQLRLHEITGIEVNGFESLQIQNYGPGGYDRVLLMDNVENDNRIATVLFYMSDVEQGGATIFPNANITVFPRKGQAIMWYNNESGNRDESAVHGACPVIVGSKWVGTQWMKESSQLPRRTCRAQN